MIKALSFSQYDAKQDGFIDAAFGTPAPEHLCLLEIGPSENYDRTHFKRAIHMTLEQVRRIARTRLPNPGTEIILYGERGESRDVREAAEELARQGYFNLFLLEGDKEAWLKLTRPRESTLVPADHFAPISLEEEMKEEEIRRAA